MPRDDTSASIAQSSDRWVADSSSHSSRDFLFSWSPHAVNVARQVQGWQPCCFGALRCDGVRQISSTRLRSHFVWVEDQLRGYVAWPGGLLQDETASVSNTCVLEWYTLLPLKCTGVRAGTSHSELLPWSHLPPVHPLALQVDPPCATPSMGPSLAAARLCGGRQPRRRSTTFFYELFRSWPSSSHGWRLSSVVKTTPILMLLWLRT